MTPEYSKDKPSIWEKLRTHFPALPEWGRGTIVCAYNGKIHHNTHLSPDMVVHEMVHVERQLAYGVDDFVDRYIRDRDFRYKEELIAFIEQLKFLKKTKGDEYCELIASDFAWALSGPLYKTGVTYSQCLKDIQEGVHNSIDTNQALA